VSEILPVFSRKPLFGYKGLIFATIAIAGLSVTVWAHHMFVTGAVLLPFFSFMTFLIAVPTGVKFFNWVGTMWRGSITFETPMLWSVGFLVTFLFGGLTGMILASPPLDFHVSDSYFVVAHFHYVVFGTVVFAMFAGFYFWWPKMTGTMLDERLGKLHFWTLFIGFHGRSSCSTGSASTACLAATPTTSSMTVGPRSTPSRRSPRSCSASPPCPSSTTSGAPAKKAPRVTVDDPWGLRRVAGVGDVLPAAPAQLRVAAEDPLGAARLRPPSPRGRTPGPARAGQEHPRQGAR
jgi:cytochrome c oxidase subunit 1